MTRTDAGGGARLHARDLGSAARLAAFACILSGYFFYCYNWVVLDYVRPYLVSDYGMTLNQTALLYTAESVGALIGSFATAWLVARLGRKRTLILITLLNGSAATVNLLFVEFAPWFVLRGVLGLALGGYYVVAVSLIVSLFEPRHRGRVEAIHGSTFAISLVLTGAIGARLGDANWSMLLWLGGLPPLLVALLMMSFVPDDRRIIGYGEELTDARAAAGSAPQGSWKEMLSPPWFRFTATCILLSGINFVGYQFFSGFVTTYLKTVREFDATTMGMIVSAQGIGSFIGGLFWGHIADTLGRRINLVGFLIAAVFICLYFVVPSNALLIGALGFGFGFGVSCTYAWGVYYAELFPVHLRPFGASLFHGGRMISLFSPSVVALIAESYDLTTGMWLAPVVFALGALLWSSLPETHAECNRYRGYTPETALEESRA